MTKVLNDIKSERNGDVISRTAIRDVISMLVEVGMSSKKVYEQEFEKRFIEETEEYYNLESNSIIINNPTQFFLKKA